MNVVPLCKVPSRAEAEKILKELTGHGMVSLSKHARERMAERKVNFQQVLTCLAKGKVTEEPVLANKGGSEAGYEITVERLVAGERLRVGVCLRFTQSAKVITVIKVKD